jgi:hypothetical protein
MWPIRDDANNRITCQKAQKQDDNQHFLWGQSSSALIKRQLFWWKRDQIDNRTRQRKCIDWVNEWFGSWTSWLLAINHEAMFSLLTFNIRVNWVRLLAINLQGKHNFAPSPSFDQTLCVSLLWWTDCVDHVFVWDTDGFFNGRSRR